MRLQKNNERKNERKRKQESERREWENSSSLTLILSGSKTKFMLLIRDVLVFQLSQSNFQSCFLLIYLSLYLCTTQQILWKQNGLCQRPKIKNIGNCESMTQIVIWKVMKFSDNTNFLGSPSNTFILKTWQNNINMYKISSIKFQFRVVLFSGFCVWVLNEFVLFNFTFWCHWALYEKWSILLYNKRKRNICEVPLEKPVKFMWKKFVYFFVTTMLVLFKFSFYVFFLLSFLCILTVKYLHIFYKEICLCQE